MKKLLLLYLTLLLCTFISRDYDTMWIEDVSVLEGTFNSLCI